MFTTNAVQTGTVPTLQYQEHPTQKAQGKNIENVQQKNPQQTQQQQVLPNISVQFFLYNLVTCFSIINSFVKPHTLTNL